MWPFRRRQDLLEQQRRELERAQRRAQPPFAAPAPEHPPRPPFDTPDGALRHSGGFRMTVYHGDGPHPPLELPPHDMFPPDMRVHEFSGTPGQVAGQVAKALLRSLLGRPSRR